MTHPDLTALSRIIYRNNRAKGFYDKVVVPELMESVEAHRKNKFAKMMDF